jgi:hypothetical protein
VPVPQIGLALDRRPLQQSTAGDLLLLRQDVAGLVVLTWPANDRCAVPIRLAGLLAPGDGLCLPDGVVTGVQCCRSINPCRVCTRRDLAAEEYVPGDGDRRPASRCKRVLGDESKAFGVLENEPSLRG